MDVTCASGETMQKRTTPEHHDEDGHCEINEDMPLRPLPTDNLPQLKKLDVEEQPTKPVKKGKSKTNSKLNNKSGVDKAMDILDQYYEGTPLGKDKE
jgi:hypothetical protein